MAKGAALIEEATQLYIQEGLTLEAIAKQVPDVSRATLERWKAKYDWDKRRARHRKQEADIDSLVHKARLRLANELNEEGFNPQVIYALARGIAVLKPSAAMELRKIEQEEKEARALNPEEKKRRINEAIGAIYGVAI